MKSMRTILALGLATGLFLSCASTEWCPCSPDYNGGVTEQDDSAEYSDAEIAAITKATADYLGATGLKIVNIKSDTISGSQGVVVRWLEATNDPALGEAREESGVLVLELKDGTWTPRSSDF